MFCKNCGKEVNENAAFCPHCGTAVSKPKEVALKEDNAPVTDNPTNEAVNTDNKPKDKNKKTNIYGLLGFVLSICVWVIFSFLKYQVYICTSIACASLALSIVGYIFAEKKGYNFKSLALAGIIISIVAILFWPLYELTIATIY